MCRAASTSMSPLAPSVFPKPTLSIVHCTPFIFGTEAPRAFVLSAWMLAPDRQHSRSPTDVLLPQRNPFLSGRSPLSTLRAITFSTAAEPLSWPGNISSWWRLATPKKSTKRPRCSGGICRLQSCDSSSRMLRYAPPQRDHRLHELESTLYLYVLSLSSCIKPAGSPPMSLSMNPCHPARREVLALAGGIWEPNSPTLTV